MYLTAFICLRFLKAWKIGEMERLTELEEKALDSIDPVRSNKAVDVLGDEAVRVKLRTTFIKRILIRRKV